ncbi:MAG TPA: TlpA disulfide reductase family protein [Tepidisphaeraceae bacterium]|jgi:peroxiredoxin
MHWRVLLATVFAFATVAVAAEPDSRAARLKAIEADVASAGAALKAAHARMSDRIQDDAAVERLSQALVQKRQAAYDVVLQIAKEDPASDVGFDALEWLLLHGIDRQPAAGATALQLMARHHAANPRIARAAAGIALHPPYGLPGPQEKSIPRYSDAYAPAMDLLKAVAATNPDRAARGQAALGLAMQSKRLYQFFQYQGRPNIDGSRSQAARALNDVIKDYGDCPLMSPTPGYPTIGDRARAELFEMERLQPGSPAPEIAGEDLDGVKFKLSDYRGKVVLLVFWASWCGPCMAEVPHVRELLEQRFKDKPFAVVGVNADADAAQARHAVASHHIPWRSLWNGPDGAYGPIDTQWNLHSLPTVYLLDPEGVIRYAYLSGDELDKPVAKLVAEVETESSTGRVPANATSPGHGAAGRSSD